MINFGIYLDTLKDEDLLEDIKREIVRGKKERIIKDASLFYEQISFIREPVPCGMFHSSDIWNFSGSLLVLSATAACKIENITNNIRMYVGYGWGDRNVLSTIKATNNSQTKFIARTPELASDFYRVTGKQTLGFFPSLENVLEIMSEKE